MDVTNTIDLAAFHSSISAHSRSFYLVGPAAKPTLVDGRISYGRVAYTVSVEGGKSVVRSFTNGDEWQGQGSTWRIALSALMDAHSDCPPLPEPKGW